MIRILLLILTIAFNAEKSKKQYISSESRKIYLDASRNKVFRYFNIYAWPLRKFSFLFGMNTLIFLIGTFFSLPKFEDFFKGLKDLENTSMRCIDGFSYVLVFLQKEVSKILSKKTFKISFIFIMINIFVWLIYTKFLNPTLCAEDKAQEKYYSQFFKGI